MRSIWVKYFEFGTEVSDEMIFKHLFAISITVDTMVQLRTTVLAIRAKAHKRHICR